MYTILNTSYSSSQLIFQKSAFNTDTICIIIITCVSLCAFETGFFYVSWDRLEFVNSGGFIYVSPSHISSLISKWMFREKKDSSLYWL